MDVAEPVEGFVVNNTISACWSDDPDERPSIQIVVSCLRSIIDHSIKSITNEIKNEALDNDFEYMFDDYDLSIHDNIPNIVIDDFSLNTSDLMKKNLLLNLSDLTNNVEKIVDKLIDHLIRLHDELGYDPTEIKEIITERQTNDFNYADWIEKAVENNYIIYFNYNEFTNKQEFENSVTCWADDPNKRPSIQRVVLDLKSIIYRENNEKTSYSTKFIKNGIEKGQSNEDFDNMMENDFDLVIDFDDSGSNTNDFTQNNLVLNLADLTDNVERIDKLIDYIIELHDEKSCSFKEVKRIINQSIQNINKSLQVENIKNQTSSKYVFFQGFLYFNAIIEKRDKGKAFELFSKASKDNYPIAQVYLAWISRYIAAVSSLLILECDSRLVYTQN
ncbi:10829_t:CDS:2 [Rhizophagus irregularis]|nr:10829_t:CDS:2 [Rhizophagus irregularis]